MSWKGACVVFLWTASITTHYQATGSRVWPGTAWHLFPSRRPNVCAVNVLRGAEREARSGTFTKLQGAAEDFSRAPPLSLCFRLRSDVPPPSLFKHVRSQSRPVITRQCFWVTTWLLLDSSQLTIKWIEGHTWAQLVSYKAITVLQVCSTSISKHRYVHLQIIEGWHTSLTVSDPLLNNLQHQHNTALWPIYSCSVMKVRQHKDELIVIIHALSLAASCNTVVYTVSLVAKLSPTRWGTIRYILWLHHLDKTVCRKSYL